MRILDCYLSDFASYQELEFNFDKQGLMLIHGPTGSGKSTLCDVVPWILFGKTAKGGAVDEVLKWGSIEPSYGKISILLPNNTQLAVIRTRGRQTKDNDLLIQDESGVMFRGKDLNDTQKLINSKLGMDYDLYLASAYFHEFSQTAGFFTATAKNRRLICEQIADLSMAKKLTTNLSAEHKEINNLFDKAANSVAYLTSEKQTLEKNLKTLAQHQSDAAEKFEKQREEKIKEIEQTVSVLEGEMDQHDTYLAMYEDRLSRLDVALCGECGKPKDDPDRINLEAKILDTNRKLDKARSKHAIQSSQIRFQKDLVNPHKNNQYAQEEMQADLEKASKALEKWQTNKNEYTIQRLDVEALTEVLAAFRSTIVGLTISRVQTQTNDLLAKHFDGEIQVLFEVNDDDKLEVEITKDGNHCVYRQLSKGQRGMLKLCFGIAVMRSASEQSGIKPTAIFFDEALDGLDERFKIKAYGLLQALELEYNSVFVVEHSEGLKAMFDKQIEVKLVNGNSILEQA